MTDRRARVTRLPDGTYQVEGVAYVADEPNANGMVYPKEVLERAWNEFLSKDFRPVTFGCTAEVRLAEVIGEVESGSFEGNVLHATVRTFPSHWASAGMEARKLDAALAGSGIGDMDEKTRYIRDFHITSIGVVRTQDVTPGENSNAD